MDQVQALGSLFVSLNSFRFHHHWTDFFFSSWLHESSLSVSIHSSFGFFFHSHTNSKLGFHGAKYQNVMMKDVVWFRNLHFDCMIS